jgi:hypothetical protein
MTICNTQALYSLPYELTLAKTYFFILSGLLNFKKTASKLLEIPLNHFGNLAQHCLKVLFQKVIKRPKGLSCT